MLRLAERLADVVVTAFPGSYPRRGPKVVPIGHAIDTEHIPAVPVTCTAGDALRLLALGRTSPVKRYDLLIDATARAWRAGADVVSSHRGALSNARGGHALLPSSLRSLRNPTAR